MNKYAENFDNIHYEQRFYNGVAIHEVKVWHKGRLWHKAVYGNFSSDIKTKLELSLINYIKRMEKGWNELKR